MKCEYCELRRVGPYGLPGSVYEQRERLRALQITERRSSQ